MRLNVGLLGRGKSSKMKKSIDMSMDVERHAGLGIIGREDTAVVGGGRMQRL